MAVGARYQSVALVLNLILSGHVALITVSKPKNWIAAGILRIKYSVLVEH